jgi:hypothetical protein
MEIVVILDLLSIASLDLVEELYKFLLIESSKVLLLHRQIVEHMHDKVWKSLLAADRVCKLKDVEVMGQTLSE